MTALTPAARRQTWLSPVWRSALERIGRRVRYGVLTIELPDGARITWRGACEPGLTATWRLHDYGVFWELVQRGPIALGETYWEGRWESDDLGRLLTLLARNEAYLKIRIPRLSVARLGDQLVHWRRGNTRRQAERNIHAHYDLGNAFYEAWLDASMTYSAARYLEDEIAGDDSAVLERAQHRKYAELAAAIGLEPAHRVLEIGCGWGGFAAFAAREIGCHVTAITISREQYRYARQRIADLDLDALVDVRYCDYRDLPGEAPERYDRIVSIEMFEAVGEKYWPEYARTVMDLLRPGGRAGLQVITVDDRRFDTYRARPDFIQRYVFPGGMLPSPRRLADLFQQFGAAEARCVQTFGLDYARTLKDWQRNFNDEWSRIRALGFDERFRRFWNYYLTHCQTGFALGWTDVGHFVITRAARA